MIDRILVPLDGSLVAEQILPHLRRLLFRRDSEVILVRAAVPPPMEEGLLIEDALQSAAREYLAEIQGRLEDQGVRVKSEVRVGSAVGVILELADSEKVTMVALATHGETGLKRLLAGSVAQAVIQRSRVPVLVLRPFWSYELLPSRADQEDLRPMRNILLPLDDTDDAKALLPHLVELARLFEARVLLLHVQEAKTRTVAEAEARKTRVEAQLRGFTSRLREMGVDTLSVIGMGDPAFEILETAHGYEVDLIAMTTHGKSGLLRFLTGSVTERVLHESTCPMLVVRSGVLEAEVSRTDPVDSPSGKRAR
jgi:nucleotide-binding universal stress UspA family protein